MTVTVSGVAATDDGIIGLAQTGTESSDSNAREAFGTITRAVTATNSVVFYATEVPSMAIPIQLVVFN